MGWSYCCRRLGVEFFFKAFIPTLQLIKFQFKSCLLFDWLWKASVVKLVQGAQWLTRYLEILSNAMVVIVETTFSGLSFYGYVFNVWLFFDWILLGGNVIVVLIMFIQSRILTTQLRSFHNPWRIIIFGGHHLWLLVKAVLFLM